MKNVHLVAVFFWMTVLVLVTHTRAKRCTNVVAIHKIAEVEKAHPCIQKYEARCGWLSLEYCTFYHQMMCTNKVNESVTYYRVETDCCKGYVMARNKTCIKMVPGKDYRNESWYRPPVKKEDIVIVDDSMASKNQPDEEEELSPGVYAGIACAFMLVCAIFAFVLIRVRKRKKRAKKKPRQEEMTQDRTPMTDPRSQLDT